MKEERISKKELEQIINDSADEFAKSVKEEVDNMSKEESDEIDRILEIKDPVERMKEMKKLYPCMDDKM